MFPGFPVFVRAFLRTICRFSFLFSLSFFTTFFPILLFFSRVLRDSTPRFVGPSVRRSVRPSVRRSVHPSHFTFLALMGFLALLLLPKCFTDRNYGPCRPARDWGSRVSGLVLVAWYTTTTPHFVCPSVCWLVGQSVSWLVSHSHFIYIPFKSFRFNQVILLQFMSLKSFLASLGQFNSF